MKLNAAVQMMPLSWKFISQIHPFSPIATQAGYQTMMTTLGKYLCEITDLDDVSFQPNSGAQGEYAGILAIRRYLDAQGQQQRRVALIPTSAHGTNPASAVIAGFDVVPIRCNDAGEIDLYLRVLDPNDRVISENGEEFNYKTEKVTYTSKKSINYQKSSKDVIMFAEKTGGKSFEEGLYKVQVYTQSDMILVETFTLK